MTEAELNAFKLRRRMISQSSKQLDNLFLLHQAKHWPWSRMLPARQLVNLLRLHYRWTLVSIVQSKCGTTPVPNNVGGYVPLRIYMYINKYIHNPFSSNNTLPYKHPPTPHHDGEEGESLTPS